MSFSAVASYLPSNGLALQFHSSRVHGNRVRPGLLRNLVFSRQTVSHWGNLVQLQHGPHHPSTSSLWRIEAFASGDDLGLRRDFPGQISLDAFLSVVEVLCIVPSVALSIGGVVGYVLPGLAKPFQVKSGNVFFVVQYFLLLGAVVVGCLIRHRQWQSISHNNETAGCDLIGRIEKVEDGLGSSTTIIRVLSRQLEKLGIRFRVTRKSLKEPISETAALTQKNSEATRALALQADILEKELFEIQKVLLAMQEQQQKQLDLILAIAKAGRLFESKRGSSEVTVGKTDLVSEKKELEQIEMQTGKRKGSSNDRM